MRAPSCFEVDEPTSSVESVRLAHSRAQSEGKFLYKGGEKFFVKGVTYGTFRPNGKNLDYPNPEIVDEDFQRMRDAGFNTARLYTVPPRWLLDSAQRHGLALIIGLPWSQHIAFLHGSAARRGIIQDVRDGAQACAGHPAVLAYAIGNEIPSQVVRWHGARRVERFLSELYQAVKLADPDALVTYANYPSTEYLDLPFIDFSFFNVYLESTADFDGYVARLQSQSAGKPLIMAELGLDSRRHGDEAQAGTLQAQVSTAFARGCAGVCVFSWTDEWHRGGIDVEDWDFGLTGRDRRPKRALYAVRRALEAVPSARDERDPPISVVVCTYNGAATIHDCLDGLARVEYPDYEVIVVNDGSTDATASIAAGFDARLITTPNNGLSAARNVGMRAATGEIVAYIDDDARPDPHWLLYLARTFEATSHAAIGGPNLSPSGDGFLAQAVDHSPGNPVHILIGDDLAEHIPGCNMAIRKSCLDAIDGFDPRFRVAGDDVDMCWRLQQRGWTVGFSPSAVVWHHRRGSIRAYWRQQVGYGRAEALLERKWPEHYNGFGHPVWSGRVYGNGAVRGLRNRQRIYQGVWGSAGYQSTHETPPGRLESLLAVPEWYFMLGGLLLLTAMTPLWTRMALFAPALAIAATTTVLFAMRGADVVYAATPVTPIPRRIGLRLLTTFLHLLQPLARLWGRMSQGLTPWGSRSEWGYAWPRPMTVNIWSEAWRSTEERLGALSDDLRRAGYIVRSGEPYDQWDLEVQGGLCAATRIQMLIEEHGWGNQYVRFRCRQRYSRTALLVLGFFAGLAVMALRDEVWSAAAILGFLAAVSAAQVAREAARSTGAARTGMRGPTDPAERHERASAGVKADPIPAGRNMPLRRDGHRQTAIEVATMKEMNHGDAFSTDIE